MRWCSSANRTRTRCRASGRSPTPIPIWIFKETHIAARELDNGVRRAEAVYRTAFGLKHLGYTPDIIIGHHGWGEMLNLRDLWPDVPMLGYMEFYYQHDKADVGFDPEFPANPLDFPRIRAKNAINHIALNLGGDGTNPHRSGNCRPIPTGRSKTSS